MTDLQRSIKENIEQAVCNYFGEKVIVEYVPDVNQRIEELKNSRNDRLNNVYEADHFTGAFIPKTSNSPFYILVQESRAQQLDIVTVFHECQHLIDYIRFSEVFAAEGVTDNPLYATFNIYSEFAATRTGVVNYLHNVSFTGTSYEETCKSVLDTYYDIFTNMDNIDNRYKYLIHAVQFLGCVLAVKKCLPELSIEDYLYKVDLIEELKDIVECFLSFDNTKAWYEKFDYLARVFIQ